jgi:signal transduction histidine kinase
MEEVVIGIKDDGAGADLSTRHRGLGLVGMRERIEMLGGTLRVQSAPSRGFEILAHVPLAPRQPKPEERHDESARR